MEPTSAVRSFLWAHPTFTSVTSNALKVTAVATAAFAFYAESLELAIASLALVVLVTWINEPKPLPPPPPAPPIPGNMVQVIVERAADVLTTSTQGGHFATQLAARLALLRATLSPQKPVGNVEEAGPASGRRTGPVGQFLAPPQTPAPRRGPPASMGTAPPALRKALMSPSPGKAQLPRSKSFPRLASLDEEQPVALKAGPSDAAPPSFRTPPPRPRRQRVPDSMDSLSSCASSQPSSPPPPKYMGPLAQLLSARRASLQSRKTTVNLEDVNAAYTAALAAAAAEMAVSTAHQERSEPPPPPAAASGIPPVVQEVEAPLKEVDAHSEAVRERVLGKALKDTTDRLGIDLLKRPQNSLTADLRSALAVLKKKDAPGPIAHADAAASAKEEDWDASEVTPPRRTRLPSVDLQERNRYAQQFLEELASASKRK